MTLYVVEFARAAKGAEGGGVPAPQWPSVTDQTVSVGAASAQSSAFKQETNFVLLHAGSNCHVDIAENPTATTSKLRMNRGEKLFMGVRPTHKVAVIKS